MTDIRVTRTVVEVSYNLASTSSTRITRSAVEVAYGIPNTAPLRITRTAVEVIYSYYPVFDNIPHTEIWSGFPVDVKQLPTPTDIPLLKDVNVTLSNGTKPYTNTSGWVVYNGGQLLINGNGRLYTATDGSWYQQKVELNTTQRDYINARNIKIQATFNMLSWSGDTDNAALYVSFLDYYGNWIGGKGIDFTDFPTEEPGVDYIIEEWVPMGAFSVVFEIIASRESGTVNDVFTGSVSAILINQIDRKHVVLKSNRDVNDSITNMVMTAGINMPSTNTFGKFNYPGRYGGTEVATTGYYEINAPEETLKSIVAGTARISLGTYQFNENLDDQSRVFLEALDLNDQVLSTLTTGALTDYGITGTVDSLENNSIPPTTSKFRLWMDYARIDGTTLDAVITNLIAIIDYDINAPDIVDKLIWPTGILSDETFGSASAVAGVVNLIPTSINSEEIFGAPVVILGDPRISPVGITSEEAFGIPLLFDPDLILPTSILSEEAFGAPLVFDPNLLLPTGILSAEVFGVPTVVTTGDSTILPTSIASEETFGAPTIVVESTASVVEMTVLASKIDSDLTDFLLLLNLADMPAHFWANVASDGSDCFVTDNSDTLLDYFFIDFDSVGETGYIQIKTNMSSTVDNVFKIKYAGGDTDQQDVTNALLNYIAFFVASDDGNLYELVTDTSWTDGDTTTYVSENMSLHPQTGYPIVDNNRIEGTTSDVYIANALDSHTSFTLAITSKYQGVTITQHKAALGYATDFSASPDKYTLGIHDSGSNPYATWNQNDGWLDSSVGFTNDRIVRSHLSTDSGVSRTLYEDGVQVAQDLTVAASTATLDTVFFGTEDASSTAGWDGNLAHGYIRKGTISADFISAEYDNMNSPATFYALVEV